MKKKQAIWALVLVVILGGAGYLYNSSLPRVEVTPVNRGSIAESIEESGYTRANESYQLQAPSSGRILTINVENGQQVKANETIMQMQDLTLEADLAEVNQNAAEGEAAVREAEISLKSANLDLEDARSNYTKTKTMFESNAISKSDYDVAVTTLKKAEQSVELLKTRIANGSKQLAAYQNEQGSLQQEYEQLTVKSPIDGYILSLPVKKSQLVQLGSTLAVIGTPHRLEAYVEILSNEVVQVKPGLKATVSYGGEGQTLTGRVKEVYPQAQEKLSALNVLERRVPVVITLDSNGPLQPGYEVKVKINYAIHDKTLIIPREALISGTNGESQVRIADSGKAKTCPVKIGLKNQQQVEILQGLQPGNLVIRDGSLSLSENSRIKVIK